MGIYARHDNEWYRVDEGGSAGELPGLGGWATITDVKGKGTKHSYNDGSTDWVAFEWTADGSVTTNQGLLEYALVGGGNGTRPDLNGMGGSAGLIENGIVKAPITQPAQIVVGKKGAASGTDTQVTGGVSSISGVSQLQVGDTQGNPIYNRSFGGGWAMETFLTGKSLWLGLNSKSTYGKGTHANPANNTQDGVVIVRVPKSNYTGNLPDGAFDIPTTRQAIVEAIEEKVEEAKEAVRDRRNERRKRR